MHNNDQTRHTSTKAAARLTCFQIKRLHFNSQRSTVPCLSLPSADPQQSSPDINNIETQTAINDIIAHDEYQAFWWDPQWACLGFLLKQTLSAMKNIVLARR